ncbi:hypothetical protein ACFYZ9_35370 [Streptomyces sp. NPDC001691]|uniref:hypothetical protein n=1 Tax=Streptomyces sp. NPDC001691 TaxID=3364600 RepID=UPI0036C79C7B
MSTKTIGPGKTAAAPDEWLAKKLIAAGFGGKDCDFPDCTNARAPRTAGKSGSPTKFCVQHNNPRDRQIAYRARQKLEKERAARPAPVPVQTAVARAAREEQVLASLLPRVLSALETVQQGQKAGADTAAVAAHIADVTTAAEEQVREAEQAREAAAEQAERSEETAKQARAEEAAALLEAACALGEAGAADARAAEALAAHAALDSEHQALRTAHGELETSHRQLTEQHETLTGEHAELTAEHANLVGVHGRLQGEVESLRARVAEQGEALEQLQKRHEENLAALATAQTENTGLTSRMRELSTHRDELDARNTALTGQLEQVHADYRRELAALRRELAAALRAGAAPGSAQDAGEGDAPATAVSSQDDERETGSGPDDAVDGARRPVSLVDLGRHAGSGWALVRYDDETDSRWYLLRDGERAGSVQPEYPGYGTSRAGWSARTANVMPVKPSGAKHFTGRDKAAAALIRDCVRRIPSPAVVQPSTAPSFVALDEEARTALVAAVIPLATAGAPRWAKLSTPVLDAALNIALRIPTEDDLQQLAGLDVKALGRGKDAQQLLAALQCLRSDEDQSAAQDDRPVDLGTIGGRAWRLEPDPANQGGYRVLADGTEVGAVAPVRRSKTDTVRWTAEHRRRSLGRSASHADRDAAGRAVTDAEAAWVPLPELDDDAFRRIPAWQRSNLYGAAGRIDLRRGRLAQLQPGAYRRELHQAIVQARRSATGQIRGQHLTVLLDVAREDLGSPSSGPAQRLYEVVQEIREGLVSPAP